ncbi:cell adhesion molecule CEACAM5-like [Ptychodera flava]|uniref:cell adhesion molecule CEACAM5-like n=1 Tax=Ptychodera flava TaxID=63121 RepID=UPI00396A393A
MTVTPTFNTKEGNEISILCEANNGNPYSHKLELIFQENIIHESNTQALDYTIASIEGSHSGIYQCNAYTLFYDGEEKYSSLTQEVIVYLSPIIVSKKTSFEASIDDAVPMPCKVHGFPTPSVSWFEVNDSLIPGDEENKKIMEKATEGKNMITSTLTVIVANESYYGKYTCKATNRIEPDDEEMMEVIKPRKLGVHFQTIFPSRVDDRYQAEPAANYKNYRQEPDGGSQEIELSPYGESTVISTKTLTEEEKVSSNTNPSSVSSDGNQGDKKEGDLHPNPSPFYVEERNSAAWYKGEDLDQDRLTLGRTSQNPELYEVVGDEAIFEYNLRILNATEESNDKYICSDIDLRGYSEEAYVYVIDPPDVSIVYTSQNPMREETDFSAECEGTDANPEEIEYTYWIGPDGKKISDSTSLLLKNVSREMSGGYTCVMSNVFYNGDKGNGTATVEVDVQYLSSINMTVTPFINITEGDEVTIHCEALDGNPAPHILELLFEDSIIGHSDETVLYHTIASIEASHSGIYQCNAYTLFYDDAEEHSSITCDIVVYYSPEFVSDELEFEADIGDDVSISCEVHGYPTPAIKWFDQNSDIITGEEENLNITVRLSETLVKSTLTVTVADESYYGRYTCSNADTIAVAVTCTVIVVVLIVGIVLGILFYNKRVSKKQSNNTEFTTVTAFIVKPVDTFVRLGDSAQFNCTYNGAPALKAWYKGTTLIALGETLQNSTGHYEIVSEGNVYNLRLHNATSNEEGEYDCTDVAERTRGAKASIYVINSPDVVVKHSQNPMREGSRFSAICDVIDANPDKINDEYWIDPVGDKVSDNRSLSLVNVSRQDSGEYTCVMTNVFYTGVKGNGTATIVVDIQYLPYVNMTVSPSFYTTEGEEVTVHCESLNGKPDSHKLELSHKENVIDESITQTLHYTVASIERSQGGIYQCNAYTLFDDGKEEYSSMKQEVIVYCE